MGFLNKILKKDNGNKKKSNNTFEEDIHLASNWVVKAVRHIAKFTSEIWQIHPFGEGNTRSTAVFMQLQNF